MVNFLGLEWHWYGLLVGLGIWIGWELVEHQAKLQKISREVMQKVFLVAVAGGLLGARLYHIITDWEHYWADPISILFIWQGGLSIIGAVLGGLISLFFYLKWRRQLRLLPQFLDVSVFGLPIGQAIGRLGNYVNQELYGRPSNLPWAIEIDYQFRLPGFEGFATYHPLFAYEILALLFFAGASWWLSWHRRGPKVGTGIWFGGYLLFYAGVRFGLEFLRLDARPLGGTGLTVNQVVMGVVLVLSIVYLIKQKYHD